MAENKIEEEYKKIREILKKENGSTKYNANYITRQLHENENLRRVFLAIIRENPSRISEVSEISLLTKPTCYSQLYKLLGFHLIEKIGVMQVINGNVKNEGVKNKFSQWTKNMPENLKMYYLAKTSYWVITDLGKQLTSKAFEFDREFKEKKDKEENKNG